MSNNVSKTVEKFLSSLEKKVLDLQLQVENLHAKNREYSEVDNVISSLQASKINFSVDYLNRDTKEVLELLEKAVPNEEQLNYYLAQMTNYYYLYETGLLNSEETQEQTKSAEKALDDLLQELITYRDNINIIKNREIINELKELEQKIISFGSAFGYVEEEEEVVDLELFVELMEDSRLTEEEKVELLQIVIKNNTIAYERQLSKKTEEVIKVFEQNQEEALDELEEYVPDTLVTTIDKESLERVEQLLRDPETIKRIVRIVADIEDIQINLDGTAFIEEQEEIISDSLEIAKEGIIELLDSKQADNPEEALDIFMEDNDEALYDAELAYAEMFGEEEKEPTDVNIDEYLELIQKGIEFHDQNKKLLRHMTIQEKESIDNYARGLYSNKNNRVIVYKSKNYTEDKSIYKDATYEIGELLKIFKNIEMADKLTNEIIIKIGRRIGEILETVELTRKVEKDEPVIDDKPKKGIVHFVPKGTSSEKTIFEDEIGITKTSKGISQSYYKELLFQIEQLENRSNHQIPSIRPNYGRTYPYTRDFGVRIISGGRIATFYIPVGETDSIIVGVRLIDNNDDYRKTLETRLRTHASRIEELIEKVNAEEDRDKAKEYLDKIKSILSQGTKSKDEDEIDSMFTVPKVELQPPKKK